MTDQLHLLWYMKHMHSAAEQEQQRYQTTMDMLTQQQQHPQHPQQHQQQHPFNVDQLFADQFFNDHTQQVNNQQVYNNCHIPIYQTSVVEGFEFGSKETFLEQISFCDTLQQTAAHQYPTPTTPVPSSAAQFSHRTEHVFPRQYQKPVTKQTTTETKRPAAASPAPKSPVSTTTTNKRPTFVAPSAPPKKFPIEYKIHGVKIQKKKRKELLYTLKGKDKTDASKKWKIFQCYC